jgi:hypothetical protein
VSERIRFEEKSATQKNNYNKNAKAPLAKDEKKSTTHSKKKASSKRNKKTTTDIHKKNCKITLKMFETYKKKAGEQHYTRN